jgi:hypothetical protein
MIYSLTISHLIPIADGVWNAVHTKRKNVVKNFHTQPNGSVQKMGYLFI